MKYIPKELFKLVSPNVWKGETQHTTFTVKKAGRGHFTIDIQEKVSGKGFIFNKRNFRSCADTLETYETARFSPAAKHTPCPWMDAIESTQEVWEKAA
jgi:hypothetical protein